MGRIINLENLEVETPQQFMSLVVLTDGLITAVFGRGFMELLFRNLPRGLQGIPRFFMRWPRPWLRLGAVLQAMAGAWLFLASQKE